MKEIVVLSGKGVTGKTSLVGCFATAIKNKVLVDCDVDEVSKRILKKELINAPEHQPGLLPLWLAEKKVSTVLAGGMGANALRLFQQKQMNVVIGVLETDPEKAVLRYLNGDLITGSNVCEH